MNRRNEVQVCVDRVGGRVDHDHPGAARRLDGETLVDAGIDAPLADHDLARRRGQRARIAEPQLLSGRQRRFGRLRQGQARAVDGKRAAGTGRGRRMPVVGGPVDGDLAQAVAVVRTGRGGGDPRARMSDRRRRGTAVACGGAHVHAGRGGEQERDLDGVGERGLRPRDRVVDGVDPVLDGLVDRRRGVRGVTGAARTGSRTQHAL